LVNNIITIEFSEFRSFNFFFHLKEKNTWG